MQWRRRWIPALHCPSSPRLVSRSTFFSSNHPNPCLIRGLSLAITSFWKLSPLLPHLLAQDPPAASCSTAQHHPACTEPVLSPHSWATMLGLLAVTHILLPSHVSLRYWCLSLLPWRITVMHPRRAHLLCHITLPKMHWQSVEFVEQSRTLPPAPNLSMPSVLRFTRAPSPPRSPLYLGCDRRFE